MTQFKRQARLHQARWRRRRGLPIGVQVRRDGTEKPVGSRVALDVAMDTGANFLSEQVRRAVEHRLDNSEPHQMIDESRLWSDLLSSMPLCFNLFGELWADRDRAAAAVTAWFPDAPGTVAEIRFEWSPGRLDPNYLGNRSAFDGAFLLDLGDGRRSVIGVETKHHEHAARQQPPSEARLARYREVAERAGVFREGWEAPVVGTDLQQLWLDHLLALSMLQHPEGRWGWARFVLVHPARNPSFAEAATRYRDVLTDTSTFDVRAVEEFIDAEAALPRHLAEEFRERYLRMLDTGEP